MFKVLKFGGTSVGTAEAIRKTAEIVSKNQAAGIRQVVVVSALSGVTNVLLDLANLASTGSETWKSNFNIMEQRHYTIVKDLLPASGQSHVLAQLKVQFNFLEDVLQGVTVLKDLSLKSRDLISGFGERVSAIIVSAYYTHTGLDAVFTDARNFIKTDASFGNGRVLQPVTNTLINQHLVGNTIYVVTGFVSSTLQNEPSTLGRGGSDYTASLLASALKADLIEIWTDVDGMLTADPKMVKGAFTQPSLSYQEAMELCHFGAKVIYPPTLQPAFVSGIPIRVCNTFNPEVTGTYITKVAEPTPYMVKGISSINRVAVINIQGIFIVGVAGVSAKLFAALASQQVNVILISQASSEHSICLAVSPQDAIKAKQAIEEAFAYELQTGAMEAVQVREDLSVIAAVGENMRQHAGVSGRLFTALGRNGVNIVASAQGSSELNISVVVSQADLKKAVNVLHDIFFFTNAITLNLFLIGPGLIGKTLVAQIAKQQAWLVANRNLSINLAGVINTKKMLIDEDGIELTKWEKMHGQGSSADLAHFIDKMVQLNLPNSVLADCTAGTGTIGYYEKVLKASIPIVTPNKTANSGPFERYKKLRAAARKHNTNFLYETNAGAGLPIITTLKDLISSGDRVQRIEGVLSGTLSYIFNNFGPEKSFKRCVAEAQELGFTEPDPRDDLSGLDMARKMLILAREMGYVIEPEELLIDQILPDSCLVAKSVAEFYECLEKENAYFDKLSKDATAKGEVVRFIGSIEEGKVQVKLTTVGPSSPFYAMSGSDNMVVYITERYKHDAPMVIKGPGAGAAVTAAGVFAEVIGLGNQAALKRL